MINQYQLLLLMPLTGAYFPKDIIDYFKGMSFTSLNLNFVPLPKVPLLKYAYEYFGFEQENEYFIKIDIEYGSTFLNNFQMI